MVKSRLLLLVTFGAYAAFELSFDLFAARFTSIDAALASVGEIKMSEMEPARRDALLAFRQVRGCLKVKANSHFVDVENKRT